jgi:hypothetical protein
MMNVDLSRGPYVQAALLCDRVLQEDNGRVTIVGLLDRVVARSKEPQREVPATQVSCHAVVILKTGSNPGGYKLKLLVKSPSNRPLNEFSLDVVLPDTEDKGINIVMPIKFFAKEEGVYWIEVRLGEMERPLTKTSLRLVLGK